MKKLLSFLLALSMVLSLSASVFADAADGSEEERFAKIKIPFPDEIEEYQSWRTIARYADTKEPINLSMSYDGYVHATIPAENKDRAIEGFVPEEISFTDEDDSQYFYEIKSLSKTGVMKGNENGEALPFDSVTRAEATAMVMRFLGLESMPGANAVTRFADVSKNDWFYGAVMSAYLCGIVQGDSDTTFSPNREVTREELTVMTARALSYAGLKCPPKEADNIADEDKISDWARDAYGSVGSSYVFDYSEETESVDWENPQQFLNPQKAASRYDTAYLLNHITRFCQLYPSELAAQYGFDREMPVIDGSTSTYPFTQAVYGMLFANGAAHERFPQKHSKSHASYERLINGEVDMLFASVYPASDILELAQKKGVELELIPIAYDAMIFFTNADNPAEGLTKEQISNIYVNNAYENWSEIGGSDALLYPYCRNNDSGSHAQMEKHFLNGQEIHEKIRSETTSVSMSNVLTDVMSAETKDPTGYGLGYSIYYYFNNMDLFYSTKTELKLLAIDGVYPTDETIADGSYPLANNTYVVLRKDTPENAPARKMAEFMLTEAGQECVDFAGYGRLQPVRRFADQLNVQMPADRNYMFSPLSVRMALALAANGADGETKKEILNALGSGLHGLDDLNAFYKELIAKYSQSEQLTLRLANSVWLNADKTTQQFSEEFKTAAAEYYAADANTVNSQNAVSEINAWVSSKTNQKITQIVKDSDFWAMLVNAVYFKGAWENEFGANATEPDEFTSADGKTSQIDFMHQTDWFRYADRQSVKILELPYKNRFDKVSESGLYLGSDSLDGVDVSMYLLMSDKNFDPEKELNEALAASALQRTYVRLSMPKFKIEYETNLSDMLESVGVRKAFDEDEAEFHKMFDSGTMSFTNVLHKTYINVDEKGTEAAAVTAIAMAGSSMPPEPTELTFNKPFYFIIRDNIAGETLFMGRFAFAE